MRHLHTTGRALRGAALIVALGLAARPAVAQQTFDACYVPAIGALYLINQTGLPTACLSTAHVAISWTADGVADHGALAGLTDDDHTQYLLAGARDAPNGFAVTGTFNAGTLPASGAGIRLVWYPRKGAFRAGGVDGAQWDDASVGIYSVAMGLRTTASGGFSAAWGETTTASGNRSTAMGVTTTASGEASVAMGLSTTASSSQSFAMGSGATASGLVSSAMGFNTTASGVSSTALGSITTASGDNSTALGREAKATGWSSTALGYGPTAQAYASLAIGEWNVLAGDPATSVATDPLFVAGNGTPSARSNALTLLKNGDMTIAGTLTESSDIRLKEAVEPVESALAEVLQLTPIRYRFRAGTGHPTERQIGLSAQEVERLFPELVARDSEGYLSVAYTDLAAVLVRAVQEQQAEIAALERRLMALEAALGAKR